ncbi:MAG: ATP-binding protein [Micrococcales bacterium]|nr:ATP-binding protein [Micrococcales bacterium]
MIGPLGDSTDPFGTAGLREAVLTAWRASPARFREDANTEEDHARTYYRDRVLVDLAQNAADAAVRSGTPGRLLIRLETDGDAARLVVANTGTPLDGPGVASLASMRASAKRAPHTSRPPTDAQTTPDDRGIRGSEALPPLGGTGEPQPSRPAHQPQDLRTQPQQVVGRFGVGFAAVRSVADEIEVRSTTGTVRFGLAQTRALLADDGALADEVARRGDALPVLRLPLPGPADPWPGYDTAVVAHLRDDEALAAVRAQLAEVGDPMLLALPGLAEIVVETPEGSRRVADVADRWQVRTATGTHEAHLLADRPVEERDHHHWQVTWALPRHRQEAGPTVVHAPTPTDDLCTLPALLIATFPLDPTRRRVQQNPVTDALVTAAGDTYAALATDLVATGVDVSTLVPTMLPAGELDGRLHQAVVEALRHVPVLRGPTDMLVPADAVALAAPAGHDRPLVAALARRIPALVELPANPAALRVLGVAVRPLADIVEALPGANNDASCELVGSHDASLFAPDGWTDLYDALASVVPEQAEALAHLPVPLVDGRVVRGPRGTVVLDGPLHTSLTPRALAALTRWGLRIVHPHAAHGLWERLGAARCDALALLSYAQVRTAICDLQDEPPPCDVPAGTDDDGGRPRHGDCLSSYASASEPEPEPAGPVHPPSEGVDDAAGVVVVASGDTPVLGEVAAVVAELVALALPVPEQLAPTLGLVELPAADGDLVPAHGLVLPGSPAQHLFDDRVLTTVAPAVVDLLGEPVLRALGVRVGPVLVHVSDVVADPHGADDVDVDAWPDYLAWLGDRLGPGAWVGDLVAVADLDAVADDAWSTFLATLACDRDLRGALVNPVRTPQGAFSSYTAWWLTHRADLGLGTPFAIDDVPTWLVGWLPRVPAVLADTDDEIRRALGAVSAATTLDLPTWAKIGSTIAPGTLVDLPVAVQVWRALAAVPTQAPTRPEVFEGVHDLDAWVVPALVAPARAEMVRPAQGVVPDSPMWCQRTDLGPVVPARSLADILDLPLASDLAPGIPDAPGDREPVPPALAPFVTTDTWYLHDDLTVDGHQVEWWVHDALPHAVHLAGLAAALAQLCGWSSRWALETVLTDPTRAPEALLDTTFLDG